jgi:hypothetical protein
MPNTYVALATQTVSSSAGITFSTIPNTYTDLVIVCIGVDSGGGFIRVRFNGDTGTNYSRTILRGNGTSATSAVTSNETGIFFDFLTTNASVIANVMNYSNTTTFKTVLHRSNNTTDVVAANANLYRSTSAITSISLDPGSGGSTLTGTFSLYGIANADQGTAKATGGIITEDSTYWYHTFGASGAFIPKQSLTCDVLVVAGGGGGGGNNYSSNRYGSGGGAGGLRTSTLSLTSSTAYTITVGAGGTGSSGETAAGNGVDSSIAGSGLTTFTSTGGGRGQFHMLNPPYLSGSTTGGSGGGGTNTSGSGVSAGNTPSTSPSQGNSGGLEYGAGGDLSVMGGGGGGGAGAAGSAAPSTGGGGAGGVGATSSLINAIGLTTGAGVLSSGSYYFAGGGSGNSNNSNGLDGGLGGGGKGGGNTAGTTGTVNTGGGGGGNKVSPGYAGGSGVVIVRYLKA